MRLVFSGLLHFSIGNNSSNKDSCHCVRLLVTNSLNLHDQHLRESLIVPSLPERSLLPREVKFPKFLSSSAMGEPLKLSHMLLLLKCWLRLGTCSETCTLPVITAISKIQRTAKLEEAPGISSLVKLLSLQMRNWRLWKRQSGVTEAEMDRARS